MSSRFVRASKFRHVYAEPEKLENQFLDLDLSTQTGDHNYIKSNSKFFSVAVRGGGGPVLVQRLDQPGKIARDTPTLAGHAGNVYDTEWNPFNDHMLFTSSEDCTINVWQIPEEGVTEKTTSPLATLRGHGKPVTLLKANHVANNVLASAGKDPCVKIWDVEKTEDKITLSDFGGLIQDLAWDYSGKLLATSCKDKQTRILDPRANSVVQAWGAHEGAKASKVLFLGDRQQVMTTGFTRQSKREMKGWDIRDLSKPIWTKELDQSAGVMMPFYDDDTRIVFLGGKGDGNIRYYELVDDAPYVYPLDDFRTNVPAKGLCILPKLGCNVMKCEIARFLKLTSKSVEPISFVVPRKSDGFQEDIFPETYAGVPALNADAWFGGDNHSPKKISLDPSKNETVAKQSAAFNLQPTKKPEPAAAPAKTNSSDSSDARIKELETLLNTTRDRVKQLELENATLKAELANRS